MGIRENINGIKKEIPKEVTLLAATKDRTIEEIKEAIRKNKFVVIKESVRFVPAFPIALIVTLLYGNLAYYLIAL